MPNNKSLPKPDTAEQPADEGLDVTICSADAMRYRKLRNWMSSNVPEGWSEVERLGGIACYTTWIDFDAYLDELPECNVGLCYKRPPQELSQHNAKGDAPGATEKPQQ